MSVVSTLEAELRRALTGDSEITEKFGSPIRLLDGETGRAAYPFIRLARHEIRPEETNAEGPVEHRISLEIYSRAGGRAEANALLASVEVALRRAALVPEGHHLVLFYPVFRDVFLRADGATFRGLLRLRALSEPVLAI